MTQKVLLRKQFWSYKFTSKSLFKQNKKKIVKILKVYIKIDKKSYEFTSESLFQRKKLKTINWKN